MESSGARVADAVGPADLAALFDHGPGVVTVHLATDSTLDNAAQRSLQRWRAVRDQLEAQGASARAVEALEALVPDVHLGGPGWFAVASDDGTVRFNRALPDAPARDRGRVGPFPSVLPIVDFHQRHPAHVVVLADRTGADILVGTTHLEAGDNDADDPAIHKSAPGGWSQRRYHERAERTWEQNAKAVAARVADVARLVDPAVILVAGDERAVGYVTEHLDARVAALVRHIDGSRAADGSEDATIDEARKQVATVAAEATRALLEKFREEQGQHDRAAAGLDATVAALNAARVETLLIADDPDDERTRWCATGDGDAAVLGPDEATVRGLGASTAAEARLPDALVAAAFRTGAAVRVVPGTTVPDGVAAILRY